ncbi:MAG: hypothetical protein VB997_02025 [Opitutales bacterium]
MNPKKLILWIIWGALLMALVSYGIFLRTENPEKEAIEPLLLVMFLAPLLGSLGMRVFFLPRYRDPAQVLVYFVVGMALAEGIAFIGLFLYPYFQDVAIALFAGAMLTFVPAFIKQEGDVDEERARGGW